MNKNEKMFVQGVYLCACSACNRERVKKICLGRWEGESYSAFSSVVLFPFAFLFKMPVWSSWIMSEDPASVSSFLYHMFILHKA